MEVNTLCYLTLTYNAYTKKGKNKVMLLNDIVC